MKLRMDRNKTEYYLFNAFDQMKAYSENGETYGYYGYDDAGQRMYKAPPLPQVFLTCAMLKEIYNIL